MMSQHSSPESQASSADSDHDCSPNALPIRSPFAPFHCLINGQAQVRTPEGHYELAGAPGVIAGLLRALAIFGDRPVSAATLFEIARKAGVDMKVLDDFVSQLIDSGALEKASGVATEPHRPAGGQGLLVDAWITAKRTRNYLDYASPDVYEQDEQRMRERLLTETPAALEPTPRPGWPTVRLAHPATRHALDPWGALGHLVYWTSARLRSATFLNVLDVHLKAVPSFGARHPFDLRVDVHNQVALPLSPGRYIYVPSRHELANGQDTSLRPAAGEREGVVRLSYAPALERLHWRYRYSLAYEMALLDLGHLLATVRLAARRWGICVEEIEVKHPRHLDAGAPWAHLDLRFQSQDDNLEST